MKLFGKKKEQEQLPLATAEQLLQQVFDSCGYVHNTVPLEALTSYSNYRQEKYSLQRTIIAITLAMFLLLPLLFISAEIFVAVHSESNKTNPTYDVSIDTGIPVKQIVATIDGKVVPIYETGNHEYVVQPDANGKMTVTVTLLNSQVTTKEIDVGEVDDTPPELISTDFTDDTITLCVQDATSGIDADSIVVLTEDGEEIEFSWNGEKGTLTMAYPDGVVEATIPDTKGNELYLRLVKD